MGFILELLEIKNDIITGLQKLKTASYVLLDTELPKTGKMIRLQYGRNLMVRKGGNGL